MTRILLMWGFDRMLRSIVNLILLLPLTCNLFSLPVSLCISSALSLQILPGTTFGRSGAGNLLATTPPTTNPAATFPWTESVSPKRKLAYMPALEVQLAAIKRLGLTCVSIEERFVYQSSTVKPARIGNLCFQGGRFRKVRLTYFDAGESVQVRCRKLPARKIYNLP